MSTMLENPAPTAAMSPPPADRAAVLRAEILERTRELTRLSQQRSAFAPGVDVVPYAGRVYDEEEVAAGVDSMLDFWLTLGREGAAFERELAKFLGVRSTVLTNSGSSANLLAIAALTSPQLHDRRLRAGDEIITVAAGFPTTVAPMMQHGAVPVFVDVDPVTMGPRLEQIEEAYVEGRTKAVMIAHALGNPFDLQAITEFCRARNLWLVEDNCDSLGSLYDGRHTGTFGDLSTQSFYPPHHLTLGEGGAVNVVRQPLLRTLVESFRDWGRDCWCSSGCDNTCGKRFAWQLGELPEGYDHKYAYTHLGYNLKPLEPQAAIGRAQLKKLPHFIEARRENWQVLRTLLADLEDVVEFSLPTHATGWSTTGFSWTPGKPVTSPSWFGFMLTLRANAGITRNALAKALDARLIGCRMLFGGNLVRQPAFVQAKKDSDGRAFRVIGDLAGADRVMNDALFVGTYPGLTTEHLHYIADSIRAVLRP